MKKIAKSVVAYILGYQVRQLAKRNDFKVVGVVGSIGKTSTKLAIAQTLQAAYKVCYQEGNYNDLVSIPLVFFGEPMPSLMNPFAWLRVFYQNQKKLDKYPYDVVILELGSDGPGQIAQFKKYLNLEIGVITAITPEHMEFFDSLDVVAQEELAISEFSSLMVANSDLCDKKYLAEVPDVLTYAIKAKADYGPASLGSAFKNRNSAEIYSMLASIAVALKLGMTHDQITTGLVKIKPVSGRMQVLRGINNSTIIDDTYNASPAAMKLALDSLYETKAPQKIALLGNMNELGGYAKQAHEEIGAYCDPKQLSQVITLGPDANEYLAPAARAKGCNVKTFNDPYSAGEYIKSIIKEKAVVLLKGSQNKVFAEEAIKSILSDKKDESKLVRQSPYWLEIKQKAFNG